MSDRFFLDTNIFVYFGQVAGNLCLALHGDDGPLASILDLNDQV